MLCRSLLSVAILLASLAMPGAVLAQTEEPAAPAPVSPAGATDSPLFYYLESGPVTLAKVDDDAAPAIAAGHTYAADMDLVVWVEANPYSGRNIRAAFVYHHNGAMSEAPFAVAENIRDGAAPAVAFDAVHERFLVVWQEEICTETVPVTCAWAIRGRLVHSEYYNLPDPLAGDVVTIAASPNNDLTSPALALNAEDGIFLMAFLRSPAGADPVAGDVYGQMVRSDSTTPVVLGPPEGFAVLDHATDRAESVDAAWSDAAAGTFFVAAQMRDAADATYVEGAYLSDTYPDDGQPLLGAWRIAPYALGDHPLTNDCFQPSVAYDAVSAAYVLVFGYRVAAGAEMRLLYGQRVRPTYDGATFRYDDSYAFPVAATPYLDVFSYAAHRLVATGTEKDLAVFFLAHTEDDSGDGAISSLISLNGTAAGIGLGPFGFAFNTFLSPLQAACRGGACIAVWAEPLFQTHINDLMVQRVRPYCMTVEVEIIPFCPGCSVLQSPQDCYDGYKLESEITLTAVPASGYFFKDWGGDAVGSSSAITLTMNTSKHVVATFVPAPIGPPTYLPMVRR